MRDHQEKWGARVFPAVQIAAAILMILHALYFFNQACDDAYISLGYAQRWIDGRGLTLNDIAPSEGYSNLLWVVLLAGAMKIGVDGLIAAKTMGLACAVVTTVVGVRTVRAAGGGALAQAACGVFIAGATPLAVWSVLGLETSLYAMEAAVLACTAMRLTRLPGRIAFMVAAAAMILTRPEGIFVVFGLCTLGAAFRKGRRRRAFLMTLALAIAVTLAHQAFRWSYFGTIVGNSAVHKWHPMALRDFVDRGSQHLRQLNGFYGLGGFLAVWAILILPLTRRKLRRRLLPTAVLLAELLAFHLMVGGDVGPYFRFLVPAFMPAGVLLAMSTGIVPGRATLGSMGRAIGPTLAIILGVVGCIRMLQWVPLPSNFYACPGWIRPTAHAELAAWLKDHAQPGDRVLLSEMGLIPYASRLPCLDYLGLCDRFMYEKGTEFHPERFDQHRPRFVVLGWVRQKDGREVPRLPAEAQLLSLPQFLQTFRPAVGFPFDRTRSLMESGYYANRPNAQTVELVVYRRVD